MWLPMVGESKLSIAKNSTDGQTADDWPQDRELQPEEMQSDPAVARRIATRLYEKTSRIQQYSGIEQRGIYRYREISV